MHLLLTLLLGCLRQTEPVQEAAPQERPDVTTRDDAPALADVVAVETAGKPGSYTFSVTVRSPDTGCDRYADWWEVVRADGTLAFRRILNHSHNTEQPFRRSGAPVQIAEDEVVWVRAHLRPGGYGGTAFTGTVASGFAPAPVPEGFGPALETTEPLSGDCVF